MRFYDVPLDQYRSINNAIYQWIMMMANIGQYVGYGAKSNAVANAHYFIIMG